MQVFLLENWSQTPFLRIDKWRGTRPNKIKFDENDLNYISTHDLMHTSLYSHIEQDLHKLSKKISISFDLLHDMKKHILKRFARILIMISFQEVN